MKNPLDENIYTQRTIDDSHRIRGEYFRDQTAIIHSMPFRRLKHKTQVFFAPENDHVCTRIEHVLHVATIAASICKGLNINKKDWNLNTEMAFAIGLGHDLGHAPFGHSGEVALNRKLNGDFEFIHEVNSYRVAEKLANNGKGLNLTYAVKDGIINHNGEKPGENKIKPISNKNDLDKIIDRKNSPSSYEGCIVRFSDKIAYLGRDIEDAIIADFIKSEDLPTEIKDEIGTSNGELIDYLIKDLITSSEDSDSIQFSEGALEKLKQLYKFNNDKIYSHKDIIAYRKKGEHILEEIFDYLLDLYCTNGNDFSKYTNNKCKLAIKFGQYLEKMNEFYEKENNVPKIIVCDYVAGMTDDYALSSYKQIRYPESIIFK